jgi:hypothetical protein
MESSSLLFSDLVRIIGISVAVAVAILAFALYRRPRAHTPRTPKASGTRAPARDAPTVRIIDSQHFDRLRKTVQLTPGEQVDILAAHPVVGPRFRITLKGVETRETGAVAHLHVVYSGLQVSCGPLTTEIGYNEFLVPRATRDESRTAVFHYQESLEAMEFMRIKVTAIELDPVSVELEVMQMRGNWPGVDA